MIYAALTFWLLVAVLLAWGVQQLLLGLVKPKVLNAILLPGTLVGMVGHVLGLLITGATVREASLFRDDGSGSPATTTDPKPKIPILGPIVIAMLPLLACAFAIHFATRYLGQAVGTNVRTDLIGPELPLSFPGFWQMLRDMVSVAESFTVAVLRADLTHWPNLLFIYLLVCMTIRMAPFPGTHRGALGAILLLGIGAAATTSLFAIDAPAVKSGWSVLNLTIACLLLTMLIALLLRGVALLVGFVKGREVEMSRAVRAPAR